MKKTTEAFASITVLLTVLLAGGVHPCRAQDQNVPDNLAQVDGMPTIGTFWSLQLSPHCPPMPMDPYPALDLYTDGNGNYYYDDRQVDYSVSGPRMEAPGQQAGPLRAGVVMADVLPMPGDGGSGSGDTNGAPSAFLAFTPPASGFVPCETWTNFWLFESNSTATEVMGAISNTLNGLEYVLCCKTNLSDPVWTPIQWLTASGPITSFTVTNAGANASLFFTATLSSNDLPPLIVTVPSNLVVTAGSTARFSVTATGTPPLSYQWQHDGTNLPGDTSSNLAISGVGAGNVGTYTVLVSNAICEASASAGLGLVWSDYLGAGINASPVIGPAGIYIATEGNQLFCLDPFLGVTNWVTTDIVTGQNGITPSAALANDGSAVYIGSQDWSGGYLKAFNPTNGALLWQSPLGALVCSTPAVGSDGTIYITTIAGNTNGLFSINATGGAINWFFETEGVSGPDSSIDSSPAISPDCSVSFLSKDGDLWSVSRSGFLNWFFPMPAGSYPDASPSIDGSGNILIGSGDGYAYSINPSGGLNWLFDATNNNSAIEASAAIGPDGTVYMPSTDGTLYALTNGSVKWTFSATNQSGRPIPIISSPAISEDGMIYFGVGDIYNTSESLMYAITTNGAFQWTFPTDGSVVSSPAINPADGGLVIASEGGFVYKLAGTGALTANAPWPTFHQNVRHAGAALNPACSGGGVPMAFPNNSVLSDDEGFDFDICGTPGCAWNLFSSSNLTDWNLIDVIPELPSSGYTSDSDVNVAGVTNRFYLMQSQNACSRIFGFDTLTLQPGSNLVANPLYQVNDNGYPQNTAHGLLSYLGYGLPANTEIATWNGNGFDTDTYAQNRFWLPNGDLTLLPGGAAFVVNPTASAVTVSFAGLAATGLVTNVIRPGTNYVSSILPLAGLIESNLYYNPGNGDTVGQWTGSGFAFHVYSAGTQSWSGGEPSLQVGEGFLLVTTNTNFWVQSSPACQPAGNLVPVYANPIWTNTGFTVHSNDVLQFQALGTWTGDGYESNPYPTAAGFSGDTSDVFLANSPHFSLVAFIGTPGLTPYENPQGTYEWTLYNTYFPVQPGQGYWEVGVNRQFTTDRSGELWLGFNDDANSLNTNDNNGHVNALVTIVTNH